MSSSQELRERTKAFAIRIVELFRTLPTTPDAQIIGKQLLRSGTSVGANYRAVCRARSRSEFISKLGVVVEEADETMFWLDLLGETGIFPTPIGGDFTGSSTVDSNFHGCPSYIEGEVNY